VSPDEGHFGDNDLYTNLLAQWCVDGGSWEHRLPGQAGGTPTFRLPQDKTSFLTYDNDTLRGYKQAAAVLSIYPLQYPPAEKEAKVMMDRFADKVIKDGPAMTESVHALIWARLGESDKAYDAWEKSWKEFVKEPHLLFSEKRKKTTTYFATGSAGSLQTVLYGFLGFRIDSKNQDGAQWSTPLALGRILSVRPNLPNSWKSVKFKNFTVLGRRYTLSASHSGAQVTQGDR
jgi:trehalose/maltose hydrolase-like predicted phosphorylase